MERGPGFVGRTMNATYRGLSYEVRPSQLREGQEVRLTYKGHTVIKKRLLEGRASLPGEGIAQTLTYRGVRHMICR
ncbi:MAG: DUF4278 domain-containing protein [Aphanocapsa feldmannii 277cV]|uniref:DUF4278 domain-containing protein n=1 Tax=Aphanocapsa feldmannii 277cV TaxID=2507553 RepID=A0A524RME1_9CHRO|nr:MAG: DUF4278 domain-containing protein [Aphanocapsa feldmannii 277cV]